MDQHKIETGQDRAIAQDKRGSQGGIDRVPSAFAFSPTIAAASPAASPTAAAASAAVMSPDAATPAAPVALSPTMLAVEVTKRPSFCAPSTAISADGMPSGIPSTPPPTAPPPATPPSSAEVREAARTRGFARANSDTSFHCSDRHSTHDRRFLLGRALCAYVRTSSQLK
jgi:hypothetical protein